jgi:alkyldihydroxyacetonephosphate synthase
MNGQQLEDELNRHGFTLGHFPSSIMCSTVGGWLAARSAGQFSSRYGKIEDMVLGARVVLASGVVVDTAERGLAEPDWTQAIVGSEGTLGVIVEATLRIHRCPEHRWYRGYKFPDLSDGLEAMRHIMQAGLKPCALRLYDPFDSIMALGKKSQGAGAKGWSAEPGALSRLTARVKASARNAALSRAGVLNSVVSAIPSQCLLIVGFEGPEASVARQSRRCAQIATEARGTDAGEGPGLNWLKKRYHVSFKQSEVFQSGALVDTMEVVSTWDRLSGMHDAVRVAVSPHALVLAHFSHAYREGCSIYFTFVGNRARAEDSLALYDLIWDAAAKAVHDAGGSLSHHHGVGLSKMKWMGEEHGGAIELWYALKRTLDPHGVMNPGKLFPEES